MRARLALPLVALASWDAWRLLALRATDLTAAVLVLALAVAAVWAWRRMQDARMPGALLAVLLTGQATAAITGPALLQIGAAVAACAITAWYGSDRKLPRAPLLGMVMLALPVLPTLDFLLAWPMRRISAEISVALLRLNGLAVEVQGVALAWRGEQLLFDGPCSGVRMLWAALLLASAIALAERFSAWRYAGALVAATIIAIAGNALRAASLFYLENGMFAPLQGPAAHEAVGLVAFVLLASATLTLVRPRGWRMA